MSKKPEDSLSNPKSEDLARIEAKLDTLISFQKNLCERLNQLDKGIRPKPQGAPIHRGKKIGQFLRQALGLMMRRPLFNLKCLLRITKHVLFSKPSLIANLKVFYTQILKSPQVPSLYQLSCNLKQRRVHFTSLEPLVLPQKQVPRIAVIMDEFSFECFRYEASLLQLDTNHWKAQIHEFQPDIIFAESAWRGKEGQWQNLFSNYSAFSENPLRELLVYCKLYEIPTVFWNKEDPPNYDHFIDVAKEFDYIFTTDAHCIPRYQTDAGHDRVYTLPFAAQPAIHNPTGTNFLRKNEVAFAGSWINRKHLHRKKDLENILKIKNSIELDIFDRNFNRLSYDAQDYYFPPAYQERVRGGLQYSKMLSAYRGYRVFLNVNSVRDSPTMLSRRVFELLGCGTPVISTDSEAIQPFFGNLVKITHAPAETEAAIAEITENDMEFAKLSHLGYRLVHTEHTYEKRLETILSTIGLPPLHQEPPRITVISWVQSSAEVNQVINNFLSQTHPHKGLRLLIEEGSSLPQSFSLPQQEDIQWIQLESAKMTEEIPTGWGNFIAFFMVEDRYGPHFLSDSLLPFPYSGAEAVGKNSYFLCAEEDESCGYTDSINSGQEHCFSTELPLGTVVLKRESFQTLLSQTENTISPESLQLALKNPLKQYSADRFNYLKQVQATPSGEKIGIEHILI